MQRVSGIILLILLWSSLSFSSSIIVEEADTVWTGTLSSQAELLEKAEGVTPKLTAEYFDLSSLSHLNIPSQAFLR
ncbi:MAG: hypothetical protein AB1397_03190 [bacterium]